MKCGEKPYIGRMIEFREKALVSACLLGVACRYDGSDKRSAAIEALRDRYELIPVCPEEMGGLPTPRPAAQIEGGDGETVLAGTATVRQIATGLDVTAEFRRGAERTLAVARETGAGTACLKSHSPSCGCGTIKRDGMLIQGNGITTALLKRHGIHVIEIDD